VTAQAKEAAKCFGFSMDLSQYFLCILIFEIREELCRNRSE
jgi:hypothetical protein